MRAPDAVSKISIWRFISIELLWCGTLYWFAIQLKYGIHSFHWNALICSLNANYDIEIKLKLSILRRNIDENTAIKKIHQQMRKRLSHFSQHSTVGTFQHFYYHPQNERENINSRLFSSMGSTQITKQQLGDANTQQYCYSAVLIVIINNSIIIVIIINDS